MKREDLNVRLDGNLLTISGTHEAEKKHEDRRTKVLRRERTVQSVYRQVRLPQDSEMKEHALKVGRGGKQ